MKTSVTMRLEDELIRKMSDATYSLREKGLKGINKTFIAEVALKYFLEQLDSGFVDCSVLEDIMRVEQQKMYEQRYLRIRG